MSVKDPDAEPWTTSIDSAQRWYLPDLRGLWRYRDLVMLFVRRDFVAVYKQSLLGPIWFIIQPLITTVAYTIVFGRIASIPTDGVAPFVFYFSGVVCWQYFAANLNKTSDTFASNAGIFGKVYFPRLVTPISVIISNLAQFAIQFSVLVCIILWFISRGMLGWPPVTILLLPLLLLQIAALGLGVGLMVSALTTRYRDLTYVLSFGMQLWMYATPIVYPLSQVPPRWLWLAYLNPMTSMVEGFRYMMLGAGSLRLDVMAYSALVTVVLLGIGLALFSRIERSFMDTV